MSAREQLILPRPGQRDRVPSPRTAVVAGGGLAGVAAAAVLAERGVSVVLAERESFLGGRAGAWTDRLATGEPFEMERGFHAFFRQYYNLQALLRRIDGELSFLEPLEDYPILGPGGQVESFSGLPNTPPWNVIALTKRTPTLGLRDLMGVNGLAALSMLRYERGWTYDRYDGQTAGEYLDSLRFPPDARRMLFDVFAHSFFNPEGAMSAGELLMMFHFYFSGNPEGLIFDVSKRPFSKSIWEPLRRLPEPAWEWTCAPAARCRGWPGGRRAAGASPSTGRPRRRTSWSSPSTSRGSRPSWRSLPTSTMPPSVASVEGLALTHPFAVWRMWLDREAKPGRAPFAGTTGVGCLDNISLYHLFEDESRSWVERHGGSVVELHAYAVDPGMSEPEVREDLLRAFHAFYPEFEGRAGRRGALPDPPRLPGLCPGIPRRPSRRPHAPRGAGPRRRLRPPADPQRAHGARGGVGLPGRQSPSRAPGRETRAHPLHPAPRPPRAARGGDRRESNAMSQLWKFGPPLPPVEIPETSRAPGLAAGEARGDRPGPEAGPRAAPRELVRGRRVAPARGEAPPLPDRGRGPRGLAGERRDADRPGRLPPHGGLARRLLRAGGQAPLPLARPGPGQGGPRRLEAVPGPRGRRPHLGPGRGRGPRGAEAGPRPATRRSSWRAWSGWRHAATPRTSSPTGSTRGTAPTSTRTPSPP